MSKTDNPNIKEITYGEGMETGGDTYMGHPHFPQSPYPGYAADEPTCSKPTTENKGCDAWNKCTTKLEGPYMVAFYNKSGVKSFTHCRNWMYKLQFKSGYRATDDPWEDCHMQEFNDPKIGKESGTKTKRYKMKVENVRLPVSSKGGPGPKIEPEITGVTYEDDYGDRGTDNQAEVRAGSVGDKGNRKGR